MFLNGSLKNILLVLAGLMTASVTLIAQSAAANPLRSSTLYLNAERTYYASFSEMVAKFGIFNPDQAPDKRSMVDTDTGVKMRDCSDKKFKCLIAGYLGFAVPKDGLHNFAQYTAGGVRFKMLTCYRKKAAICYAALIEGDCQQKISIDQCAPKGRRGALTGPVSYFIYNSKYGVTAFGSNSDLVSLGEAEIIGRVNVLQGNAGLLR